MYIGGDMNSRAIGSLINYERCKQNISREKLTEGICSEIVLRRIESGERCGDFFILERLISRLGKSGNKLETIQDENDYRLFLLREIMNEDLRENKYGKVGKSLAEYENIADMNNTLQLQYIKTVKGMLYSEKLGDYQKADEIFFDAINLTLPNFSIDRMEEYLMGEDEIIIILLYLRNKEQFDRNYLVKYGKTILGYINKRFQDDEIKCNLYGRVAWIIGDSFIKNDKYKEALAITLEAEDILTDNGLLLNITQILDRILFLSENRQAAIYDDFKDMRDALKDLYEEYGIKWETEKISLISGYMQKSMNIMSEFVKQERILRGLSQQKLSEDLDIDIKTVSRIESGKVLPKKGTLERVLTYFDEEKEVAESRIITNDFHLLELEREVAKLMTYHCNDEAELLFKELKSKLSLEYKKNSQYVEFMDALFDIELNRCGLEQTIGKLIKAFNITRGHSGFDKLGEFVPSRTEALIINNIAVCYKRNGMLKKSIEVLEKLIMSYENSKIELKYRCVPLNLIYCSLCVCYEETDQFDKALSLADKTIRYSIECLRGNFLGYLLEERTYTADRKTGDNSGSKQKYRQSYYIRKLMKESEIQKAPIMKAFKKWYGEEIE